MTVAVSLRESHALAPDYRHAPKHASPGPSIVLGEATLKWYDVTPSDAPVAPEMRTLARRVLEDCVEEGSLEIGEGLGFVILHRCGSEGFHFLLVGTWRNDNELWETVLAKHADSDPGFGPWVVEDGHRPTFCVWELGVVAHERLAWARYLRSARDDGARRAYLDDLLEGEV